MINNVTKKTQNKSCIINKIRYDNVEISNSTLIANSLNSYFSTVGKNFASKIKVGDYGITYYLDKMIKNDKSVYFHPTNRLELEKLIDQMVAKTSNGYDCVSNKLVQIT